MSEEIIDKEQDIQVSFDSVVMSSNVTFAEIYADINKVLHESPPQSVQRILYSKLNRIPSSYSVIARIDYSDADSVYKLNWYRTDLAKNINRHNNIPKDEGFEPVVTIQIYNNLLSVVKVSENISYRNYKSICKSLFNLTKNDGRNFRYKFAAQSTKTDLLEDQNLIGYQSLSLQEILN